MDKFGLVVTNPVSERDADYTSGSMYMSAKSPGVLWASKIYQPAAKTHPHGVKNNWLEPLQIIHVLYVRYRFFIYRIILGFSPKYPRSLFPRNSTGKSGTRLCDKGRGGKQRGLLQNVLVQPFLWHGRSLDQKITISIPGTEPPGTLSL